MATRKYIVSGTASSVLPGGESLKFNTPIFAENAVTAVKGALSDLPVLCSDLHVLGEVVTGDRINRCDDRADFVASGILGKDGVSGWVVTVRIRFTC